MVILPAASISSTMVRSSFTGYLLSIFQDV
jgi:hypothetical protein